MNYLKKRLKSNVPNENMYTNANSKKRLTKNEYYGYVTK